MSAIELKAYEVLKSKFGEPEASTLIEYFDVKTEQKFTEKKEVLATKEDVLNFRAELLEKVESTKSDMVKWMFIFWGGQVAATFGFILLFLKK